MPVPVQQPDSTGTSGRGPLGSGTNSPMIDSDTLCRHESQTPGSRCEVRSREQELYELATGLSGTGLEENLWVRNWSDGSALPYPYLLELMDARIEQYKKDLLGPDARVPEYRQYIESHHRDFMRAVSEAICEGLAKEQADDALARGQRISKVLLPYLLSMLRAKALMGLPITPKEAARISKIVVAEHKRLTTDVQNAIKAYESDPPVTKQQVQAVMEQIQTKAVELVACERCAQLLGEDSERPEAANFSPLVAKANEIYEKLYYGR
jgi:hypothetical protein